MMNNTRKLEPISQLTKKKQTVANKTNEKALRQAAVERIIMAWSQQVKQNKQREQNLN